MVIKNMLVILALLGFMMAPVRAQAVQTGEEVFTATPAQIQQSEDDQKEISRIVQGLTLKEGETRNVVFYGENPEKYILSDSSSPGWNHSVELQKGLGGSRIASVPVLTPFGIIRARLMHFRGTLQPGQLVVFAERAAQRMDYSSRGPHEGFTLRGEPYVIGSDELVAKRVTATLLSNGRIRLSGEILVTPLRDWFCWNLVDWKVVSKMDVEVPYFHSVETVTLLQTHTVTLPGTDHTVVVQGPPAPTPPPCLPDLLPPGRTSSQNGTRERWNITPPLTYINMAMRQMQSQAQNQTGGTVVCPPPTGPIVTPNPPPPGGGDTPPNAPPVPGQG